MANNYQPHRFPYLWRLADGYPAKGIEHHGCKVFGTFCCGGGSTMGYKLAGYDHIGGVELDPTIAEIYKRNHHPKHFYTMDIRDFNEIADLPEELYNLDLLDGSPPCSTFSTAGSREKAWGKEKQFTEGQKLQRLDDLVFVYCETIAKLKPKVCLLENVSGLVKGNSKVYTKQIVKRLNEIGYNVQVFLLNGTTMGVPQRRERVFIVGLRKEFHLPKLQLNFNEKPIVFGEIKETNIERVKLSGLTLERWKERTPKDRSIGDINERLYNKTSRFSCRIIHDDSVCDTLTATDAQNRDYLLYDSPYRITLNEIKMIGTFPLDYVSETKDAGWLIGMSVPPVMMAQISYQIYKQWLSKI